MLPYGASFSLWQEGSIRPPQYGPALFDDHSAVGLLVVLVNIGCVALAFVGQLFGVHAAFYEEVVNALGAVLGNALVACSRTRLLVGVALDLVDPVFRTALDQVGHQFEAGLLLRRQLRHAVIVENDRSRAEGVHLLCGSGLGGGHDEREQTLNQLLTEMDGFEGNSGVIILAATNRPDSLDPALTRPGRFDRRVPVELPDLKGREEILKVHARKVALAPGIDFNTVARMASGASGAELANIVNEAALRAVRAGRKSVTEADLEESIEVVIAGYQKKNSILTDKEKCIVAYHEIGHALVAAKQSNSAPVQKITIIPRTSGALGYTMQVDEGNHVLMSKEEIENKIATFTGGRAAEEVVFGSVTTGASNDIEQATKLARAMITRYGMSDDFDMVALETVTNQYLGGDASLACSAETQTKIDQQVVALVKREHQKALDILRENRTKLDELANFLYEKETITGEEFMGILNG